MRAFTQTLLFALTLPLTLASTIPAFTRDSTLPDALTCSTSKESPLYLDCLHSYLSLPTSSSHLSASSVCTTPSEENIFINDWTLGTAGSCKIISFHDKGDAHCIPPELVREALEAMFENCVRVMKTEDLDGYGGRDLQIVGGRWYVDGTSYGRGTKGANAWVSIEMVRP